MVATDFVTELENEFTQNGDANNAAWQKAYMKDNFEFLGLKSEVRRTLQQPFLSKEHLPSKQEAVAIMKILWEKSEREFHLFAQELMLKYVKQYEEEDIDWITYMITHKSWWDSVDVIATKIVASYFLKFPNKRSSVIKKWLDSNNLWLKRSAILFQLKYKKEVDLELLELIILANLGTKEFFINKAIGWVLREYSRTHIEWVVCFVEKYDNELNNLSKREALRLLKS